MKINHVTTYTLSIDEFRSLALMVRVLMATDSFDTVCERVTESEYTTIEKLVADIVAES